MELNKEFGGKYYIDLRIVLESKSLVRLFSKIKWRTTKMKCINKNFKFKLVKGTHRFQKYTET